MSYLLVVSECIDNPYSPVYVGLMATFINTAESADSEHALPSKPIMHFLLQNMYVCLATVFRYGLQEVVGGARMLIECVFARILFYFDLCMYVLHFLVSLTLACCMQFCAVYFLLKNWLVQNLYTTSLCPLQYWYILRKIPQGDHWMNLILIKPPWWIRRDTGEHTPSKQQPRWTPFVLQEKIVLLLSDILKQGMMEPSTIVVLESPTQRWH